MAMMLKLQTDPFWLESLPYRDDVGGPIVYLQGGDPLAVPHGGDPVPHVSVPAALLVATSPCVRRILSTDLLLTQYPPVITIPSISVDVLKIVVEMLLKGKAKVTVSDVTRMSEIEDVFKLLRIEAWLVCSQLQSRALEENIEKDTLEEDDVFDIKSKYDIDMDENDVRVKSENGIKQESLDFPNSKIEIIVKIEGNFEDCNLVDKKVGNIDKNMEENDEQLKETEHGSKEDGHESLATEDFGQISEKRSDRDVETETGFRIPRRDSFKSTDEFQTDQKLKLYKCDVCDERVNQINQLKNHAIVHSDKSNAEVPSLAEPKQCDICQKVFSCGNLKRHVRTVHSKLKPYTCHICGYQAAQKDKLELHVRQHTGEKPYNCDQCDYKTGIPSSLIRHKRSHTGDKPLHCDHCEFKTGNIDSLRNHKRRHTGEKPYKCPFCQYAAIQSCNIKRHLKSKHPERPKYDL